MRGTTAAVDYFHWGGCDPPPPTGSRNKMQHHVTEPKARAASRPDGRHNGHTIFPFDHVSTAGVQPGHHGIPLTNMYVRRPSRSKYKNLPRRGRTKHFS